MKMKTVKTTQYLDHKIIIKARYTSEIYVKIKKVKYGGAIILEGKIKNNKGETLIKKNYGEHGFITLEYITAEPTYKKVMGIKIVDGVEYLSEVYERKLKEFEGELKKRVEKIVKESEIELFEQQITDGLPDSLKEL